MISAGDIGRELGKQGLQISAHLNRPTKNVVLVKYGLLSAGVLMTHPENRDTAARVLPHVEGIDLVFWPDGQKIHVLNSKGEEAFFDYHWPKEYRYVQVKGDPLGYAPQLIKRGLKPGAWFGDSVWRQDFWNQHYPDAGYRLYEAFHNLVENGASILFSTFPGYQFGSLATLTGTRLKPGGSHKGTHGGLFQDVSWGFVMTDSKFTKLPESLRYDEIFPTFLPTVTRAMRKNHKPIEIQWLLHPGAID